MEERAGDELCTSIAIQSCIVLPASVLLRTWLSLSSSRGGCGGGDEDFGTFDDGRRAALLGQVMARRRGCFIGPADFGTFGAAGGTFVLLCGVRGTFVRPV